MWSPLETSSTIRILRVTPGTHPDPIVCNLYHASLGDESCMYQALSYTWGSLENMIEIVCDGSPVAITQNLHSALRHIRLPDAEIHLWVDALCINQSREPVGLREREQQVQMMWRIFSQAQKVVAYLGDDFEESGAAIALLHKFRQVYEDGIVEVTESNYDDVFRRYDVPEGDDSGWLALYRTCGCAYFRRVWIIQECVLGEVIQFMLGSHRFDDEFLDVCCVALGFFNHTLVRTEERRYRIRPGVDHIAGTRNMSNIRDVRQQWISKGDGLESRQHWEYIFMRQLSGVEKYFATDPRDRIYGLLGLLTRDSKLHLHVDYSEIVENLGLRVSKAMATFSMGATTFLYSNQGCKDKCSSWAFDVAKDKLTYLDTSGILRTGENLDNHAFYDCCAGASLDVEYDVQADCLRTRTVILDDILVISPPSLFEFDGLGYLDLNSHIIPLLKWLVEVRLWARSPEVALLLGDDDSEKVWRTVTADTASMYIARYQKPPDMSWLEAILDDICSGMTYEQAIASIEADYSRLEETIVPYWLPATTVASRCRMAITKSGLLALVPHDTRVGDHLAIILGAPIPFVLRPDDDSFRIVGSCYIHDMMDGQALHSDLWKPRIIDLL